MSAAGPDLIDTTLDTIRQVSAANRRRSREELQAEIQHSLARLRRRPRNIIDAIELAIQANPLLAVAATLALGVNIGRRR